jgi:hypothetical protein
MHMSWRIALLLVSISAFCGGCTEPSIQGTHAAPITGAGISYFFPESIWTFTASFDPKGTPVSKQPAPPIIVGGGAAQGSGGTKGSTDTSGQTSDGQKPAQTSAPSAQPPTSAPKPAAAITANLTVAASPEAPQIMPNPYALHYLSYTHAQMSDDVIDIALTQGSMLKKVSSDTSDQTVKAIEAFNGLLAEIPALQKALAPAQGSRAPAMAAAKVFEFKPVQTECKTKVSAPAMINLSQDVAKDFDGNPDTAGCFVRIHEQIEELGNRADSPLFNAAQTAVDAADPCDEAVCFPLARPVRLKITATLMSQGPQGPVKARVGGTTVELERSYLLVVPRYAEGDPVGYVKFTREAFVDNKTSISFDSGLVSEFQSTDPSPISGTFTAASDVLKSVVLTVPLVR